jgi:hypothetical protein
VRNRAPRIHSCTPVGCEFDMAPVFHARY